MDVIEKWRKLPLKYMIFLIFGKFLAGVGLGVLLAPYLQQCNRVTYGWGIIIIAALTQIPAAYKCLKK